MQAGTVPCKMGRQVTNTKNVVLHLSMSSLLLTLSFCMTSMERKELRCWWICLINCWSTFKCSIGFACNLLSLKIINVLCNERLLHNYYDTQIICWAYRYIMLHFSCSRAKFLETKEEMCGDLSEDYFCKVLFWLVMLAAAYN